MNSHKPNKRVRVTIPIKPDSISGELVITDEDDNELVTHTLTAQELTESVLTYIVDSAYNDIGSKDRGLRSATLNLLDSDGVESTEVVRYYLFLPEPLLVGVNSLMTFTDALLLVPDVAELRGWTVATDDARKVALREAYNNLRNFLLAKRFDPYQTVTDMNESELATLDPKVFKDFCYAQLLHADYVLGGEPDKRLRDQGVISRSVGESTTFFRTTKTLDYGISARAFKYISRYLDRAVRLVNG